MLVNVFLVGFISLSRVSIFHGIGVGAFSSPPVARPRATFHPLKSHPVIADINSPDDLRNFIMQDDRLSVVKVYANWCRTCKQFDIRYRKIAATWGESYGTSLGNGEFSGSVRFAQIEYGANEEMCDQLGATKLPYILIFKDCVSVADFACLPSNINMLTDQLSEHVLLNYSELSEHQHPELEMEPALVQGSHLMDEVIPAISQEAGFGCGLSFEEFCKEQARR